MSELVRSARAHLAPGHAAGVTEALIHDQVHAFYGKVRSDPVLGPIFEAAIDDWAPHLAKMCDFWSSVLLMSGRFKGTPMAVHIKLDDLQPHHFAIWLRLFEKTVTEMCSPEAADLFVAKANMIAQSLQF